MSGTFEHPYSNFDELDLRNFVYHLSSTGRPEDMEEIKGVLLDFSFLEKKVEFGMASKLLEDYQIALSLLTRDHILRRPFLLLKEAIRSEVQFINQNPSALFQCLWNSCWWYDCNELKHFTAITDREATNTAFKPKTSDFKLSQLMEEWRKEYVTYGRNTPWLKSLLPLPNRLDSSQYINLYGDKSINDISFAPNSVHVATAGINGVKIWDFINGEEIIALQSGETWTLDYSPNGKTIVTGSTNKSIQLWDAQSGLELHCSSNHKNAILDTKFSPDGKWISSCSRETVNVWKAKDLRLEVSHNYSTPKDDPYGGDIVCVAFSPRSDILAIGLRNGTIKLWDWSNDNISGKIDTGFFQLSTMIFCTDGTIVFCAGEHKTIPLIRPIPVYSIRAFWIKENIRIDFLPEHSEKIGTLEVSPDGQYLFSGSEDQIIKIWEIPTSKQAKESVNNESVNSAYRKEVYSLAGHDGAVNAVSISKESRYLASGGKDGVAKIWDLEAAASATQFVGQGNIGLTKFSVDGRMIFSTGRDYNRSFYAFKSSDGTLDQEIITRTRVFSFDFSPDNQTFAIIERIRSKRSGSGYENIKKKSYTRVIKRC